MLVFPSCGIWLGRRVVGHYKRWICNSWCASICACMCVYVGNFFLQFGCLVVTPFSHNRGNNTKNQHCARHMPPICICMCIFTYTQTHICAYVYLPTYIQLRSIAKSSTPPHTYLHTYILYLRAAIVVVANYSFAVDTLYAMHIYMYVKIYIYIPVYMRVYVYAISLRLRLVIFV